MADKKNIQFSKNLFWDVDVNELDMDKHKEFIVERVLDYGRLEDWHTIKEYYQIEQLGKIALNIRSMFPKSLDFIAKITNIPITEFRCYKQAQLYPTLWNS
jgi:hypothetical protein